MASPVNVKSIVLTRLEGPVPATGLEATAESYDQANAILLEWSDTAPINGGVDKCRFCVTFEDGETYSGTYGLKHWDAAPFLSLKQHIRSYCRHQAGLQRPEHVSDGVWAMTQARLASQQSQYRSFLNHYNV